MSTNPNPFGGGSGQQPYQFRPESYGALGNGRVVSDVVTNSTTTITSASANFGAADTGKTIMIHGAAGSTSGPLITTISSVTSPTTAVLAAPATASVTNCPAVWATDDTAAIQSAVTAAKTYALANQFFAEVLFGAKIYGVWGALQQVGDGSTVPTYNTQIVLPWPNPNGTTPKLVILLTGAGDMSPLQYWMQTTPMIGGTALVSSQVGPTTANATFGQQSVIGGPTGGAGFSSNQGTAFANANVLVKGMSIWLPIYTNTIAWDFIAFAQARAEKSSAMIFAPTGVNNVTQVQPYLNNISAGLFTGSISKGWRFPQNQNNLVISADDITAEGYEIGFLIWDHFWAGRMNSIYCDVALNVNRGGGIGHRVTIGLMAAEVYNGGLLTNGSGVQTCGVDIHWVAECASVTYDVNDASNYLRGQFYFQDPADSGRGITISGGGNLKIISDQTGPGHMASPPAVPATGVNAVIQYRDAAVKITTGVGVTVSAVTVDGTATGQTMAASSTLYPVSVPAGKTIALTYAGGTPTWDWWLT